jgi:hypothetical protein
VTDPVQFPHEVREPRLPDSRIEWIEIGFPQRLFAQAQFDRDIIESPLSETPVEMPQSRNDHPHHGNPDVRPGLVENEKIQAETFGKLDAAKHLIAPIQIRKFLRSRAPGGRFAVRQDVGMFAQGQRQRVVSVRDGWGGGRAPDPINRE